MTIIKHVDLRDRFGTARDQRRRPTCLAFAASDCHAAARGVPFRDLSAEYAFYHAVKRKGEGIKPNGGIGLKHMLGAIQDDGQPLESGWPYLPQLPVNLNEYKPPTIMEKIYRRRSSRLPSRFDDICDALNMGTPPLIVFSPTIQFHLAKADQTVRADATEPPTGAAHAVVGVGWGEENLERIVLVRNSWGTKWAEAGYAWVGETYLQTRLHNVVIME
jgi:hypothetical protein